MSDNIYHFESQPEDEEPVESDVDEIDEEGFTHIGYYVRRVNGDLVLVQTFITDSDDPDLANARTVYFTTDDLEPEWAVAILEQGETLLEGKSAEFIPPDDYGDDDDFEEDGDEEYDEYWDEDEEME